MIVEKLKKMFLPKKKGIKNILQNDSKKVKMIMNIKDKNKQSKTEKWDNKIGRMIMAI